MNNLRRKVERGSVKCLFLIINLVIDDLSTPVEKNLMSRLPLFVDEDVSE